ncbi:MAG TPA: PQQ-dependent sugar dehydrogenase, partial [Chitinophagaceae bacterium]|nr:PQQ-dependent sugar dehydrogenase [Chitinophagaceae bacterium]
TAPTNLAAANIVTTSFTFSWSPSTDNVGVTGYDVYKNGVKMNGANLIGTSYSVTGLLANTLYTMTVVAKDAVGNQATSSPMIVATIPIIGATESFSVRTVIANQRMPHDLVYGPDNNIWYTERFAGRVSFVNPLTNVKTIVLTLGSKMVLVGGQDGLMGLALHPLFLLGKPFVYISYTYQSLSSTVRRTRIERYTYNILTQQLESPVTVLENIPGSNDHNSARIAIGPDLKLYYSVGDMGAGQFDNTSRTNNAQNINIYEGKILRLNTEPDLITGSWIPSDNPFTNGGQPTAVYTLGHRNPQGLVWGNVNGTDFLYSSEHGPFSDDEINVIQVGRNYGWPQVAGYCDGNYNGMTIGGFNVVNEQANCAALNAKEPLRSIFPSANPPTGGDNMTWPSIGPSGTDFYGSLAIPGWQNSLLVATLKGGVIARYKLSSDGQSIISDTINYFRGMGRFRDIVVSPDGLRLYVACDSSGSTSGPTGNVTTTPANPGSILEFTYQVPGPAKAINQLLTENKVQNDLKDKSIDVYPNPATNYFVVYNYKLTSSQILLYDISGKLIKSMQSKDLATRVDVSNLANGVYILTIKGADGKKIRTEKIIITR